MDKGYGECELVTDITNRAIEKKSTKEEKVFTEGAFHKHQHVPSTGFSQTLRTQPLLGGRDRWPLGLKDRDTVSALQ